MSFKEVEIAPFGLQAAVFDSDDAAREYFRREHGHEIQTVVRFTAYCSMEVIDDAAWFFLVIPEETPVWKVAHECVHLADFVMEEVGVPTDAANTEVRAYLVDSFMQQILGAE